MKKSPDLSFSILLLIFFFAPATAAADTRYVSDELIVTVRESRQPGAEVITTVHSNEPVQVLEEGDRYLKIRTAEGRVGFIQAQYITPETPKTIIIARLKEERDRLQRRVEELQAARSPQAEELDRLEKENARLEGVLENARTELEAVREEYDTLLADSQQVVEITAERDRLQQRNKELTAELEQLEKENAQLLRTGMIRWFLAGGGVFLCGWLIGKVSRKKRRF